MFEEIKKEFEEVWFPNLANELRIIHPNPMWDWIEKKLKFVAESVDQEGTQVIKSEQPNNNNANVTVAEVIKQIKSLMQDWEDDSLTYQDNSFLTKVAAGKEIIMLLNDKPSNRSL